MNKRYFAVFLILFCFAASFSFPYLSYAEFNLTVTPSDGGFDLRFPRISPSDFKQSKEVAVRITSSIGKQYRVSQNIIRPLATMDGTALPDQQFKMYALVNSNTSGTLVYREETPVNALVPVLYTSNGSGDADSFKLIFTIAPSENQISGSYQGRIAFILTPIDSTQSQVVVNLNVYAELAAGSAPVVEVRNNTGGKRLDFSSKGMGPKNETVFKENPQVSVMVHSPMGVVYRIYQNFEGGRLISDTGEEFDLSNILLTVSGGSKGTLTQDSNLTPAKQKQLLYTSEPSGPADEFVVTYKPGTDLRFQKPGVYKGKLDFVVEKMGASAEPPQHAISLDVNIEIVPLFEMYVYSNGVEGVNLKFGEVSYKTGPKSSDVDVHVETNMGKPYQVIQKVSSPMVNEKGDKVLPEDFTVKVEDIVSKEEPQLYLAKESPVKEGDGVLFSSGPEGQSARFKAQYRLTMHPDSRGGSYATQISYSLSMN